MTARERVLAALPDDADGIVLESPGVVSWYLEGARTTVPLGGASIIAVLVRREGDQVRCHVMEADRLSDEEGVEGVVPVDWTEPLVPAEWREDPGIRSEADLDVELRAARASLTELEVARYRSLGTEVAAAVTAVASTLRPHHSEQQVAGELARSLYSIGAEPVVLLVGGATRSTIRHPLPTRTTIGPAAMLVVGARRHGLILNLTRFVRFSGSAPGGEAGIRGVEADVLDATRPGAELTEVFAALRASYVAHGFGPDEWRRHHQGGPTGYFGRDPKVTPATLGRVAENQAFAWNPSADAVKAEDTVLATSLGIEVLSVDPAWPSVDVAGRSRPLALQL